MGAAEKKKYAGYKSFQFLEPGIDYKKFELTKEIARVEPCRVPLSESEEKRVDQLNKKCIVIALHDHALTLPADLTHLADFNREGRYPTAYEALGASCLDAVFDNLWAGFATLTSKGGWRFEDVVRDLGMRLCDLAHQDFVFRADRVTDIRKAHDEGRVAFIPGMESCTPLENDLDRMDVLYGLGVRMMGLTYNEANMLGSGLKEENDGGLTDFGYRAVQRMNKLGMAVDVSHCGEKTSLDCIRASKKPVFISHAGAKGLWNSRRMKSDEVIKACAERGGVIGIEASPHTTFSRKHPQMDIDTVMDHFEYCVDLVGIEHAAFGLDSLYGDHVGLHDLWGGGKAMAEVTSETMTGEEPRRVDYVKGMENPTEGYNNIIRWLVKHGYSDEEIIKAAGGNILRVLTEVWA
jgi:membrane dipeptidase